MPNLTKNASTNSSGEMQEYQKLFGSFGKDSSSAKAKAFDELAKLYYSENFGSAKKSDIDLLMYSVYFDRIVEKMGEELSNAKSDYDRNEIVKHFTDRTNDINLSDELKLLPSTLRTLKSKKNLKFKNANYDWRLFFKQMMSKARVDDKGRVVIFVPDKTIVQELKKFVELNDGYVEEQITANLLKISPEYYIRLLLEVEGTDQKQKLKAQLAKIITENKGHL